jgi:regulator of sirC expression with transglutaminase-like and TPR domain
MDVEKPWSTVRGWAVVGLLAACAAVNAQSGPPADAHEQAALRAQVQADLASRAKRDPNLATLNRLLAQPETAIDLARAEVTIEAMIDPKVNQPATLRALDNLAQAIRARFPQGDATDNEVKIGLLLNSLQVAGPWNGNRPFRYDLDNPMGEDPKDKLLSTYLTTRKGNCVSMPVLLVVLSQKLGIEATLVSAPAHVFARVRRDDGSWLNIEATSFGTVSDAHYQQDLAITPRAIQSGAYLRSLTKQQEILVMVDTLEQYYRHHRAPDDLLGLTLRVLTTDMTNVSGWLWRGEAYAALIDEKFLHKYGSVDAIPPELHDQYAVLHTNNIDMFRSAEALGWVEETAEHKADYLRSIQQVKAQQARTGR